MSTALKTRSHFTPAATLLAVSHATLDQLMATAYLLHRDGHCFQAEVICRGMLAAEPRYWYAAALLAATLEKRRTLMRRPRVRASVRSAVGSGVRAKGAA